MSMSKEVSLQGQLERYDAMVPDLGEVFASDGDFPPEISVMNVAFAATMQRKRMIVDRALFAEYPSKAYLGGNKPRPLQPYWMVMELENLAGDPLTTLTTNRSREIGSHGTYSEDFTGKAARDFSMPKNSSLNHGRTNVDFKDNALAIVPGGKVVRLQRRVNKVWYSDDGELGSLKWRVLPKPVDRQTFWGKNPPKSTKKFISAWQELLDRAAERYVTLSRAEMHTDGVVDLNRSEEYYRNRSRSEY